MSVPVVQGLDRNMTRGSESATLKSDQEQVFVITPSFILSVKVKGTMQSETRREALNQLHTMEVIHPWIN
jgi:hypothetical protein